MGSMDFSAAEKKACSKLFQVAKEYVYKLSFCSPFLNDLSSNEEESMDFLSLSFSLLEELKSVSGVMDDISDLYPKFKESLLKVKNMNMENVFKKKYTGESEWVDEVNYMFIWSLNSYGINLKAQGVSEIKSKFFFEEAEPVLDEDEEFSKSEEKSKNKSAFKKVGSSGFDGLPMYSNIFSVGKLDFDKSTSKEDEDSFEYVVSKIQAWESLESDIKSGSVYMYIGKPVSNPKLKKWFSYFCISGLIFSSLALLKVIISYSSNTSTNGHKDTALFSVMSFIFFLLSWKETNSGLDNENFSYCFSSSIFFYYFFLSSFFLLTLTDNGSAGGYSSLFPSNADTWHKVLFSFLVANVILSVTFFLVAFFFLNPKKNEALMESLLSKYSNPPYLNN